ncbi:MAG: ribonuclease PH [Tepidisphaeraceae bacterium]
MPTRPHDQLRELKITRGFTKTAAGSVLWQQGETIVLCTASVTQDVPPWFGTKVVGGWLTAEYVMLPASTPQRKPWPKTGHTDSRGTEIQRLIGRVLRGIVDLTRIGPHTIHVDCQVLQADGGTRTASICGAVLAIRDALRTLPKTLTPKFDDPDRTIGPTEQMYAPEKALVDDLAAVSVGIIDGQAYLDLDYVLDSKAQVDLNLAYTASGKFVEIQGSAESKPAEGKAAGFDMNQLQTLLDLGRKGCTQLMDAMRKA